MPHPPRLVLGAESASSPASSAAVPKVRSAAAIASSTRSPRAGGAASARPRSVARLSRQTFCIREASRARAFVLATGA